MLEAVRCDSLEPRLNRPPIPVTRILLYNTYAQRGAGSPNAVGGEINCKGGLGMITPFPPSEASQPILDGEPTFQAESGRGAIDHLKIIRGMGTYLQEWAAMPLVNTAALTKPLARRTLRVLPVSCDGGRSVHRTLAKGGQAG